MSDLIITDIVPTHPQGFGGHIFEYESDSDLFCCVNDGCGKYEAVVRDSATGEIAPCKGIVAPDDISDYYGTSCARWGQSTAAPGEALDPVPAVYSRAHDGGQVEIGDFRLSLDMAEQLAVRLINAVRYQRSQQEPGDRKAGVR